MKYLSLKFLYKSKIIKAVNDVPVTVAHPLSGSVPVLFFSYFSYYYFQVILIKFRRFVRTRHSLVSNTFSNLENHL